MSDIFEDADLGAIIVPDLEETRKDIIDLSNEVRQGSITPKRLLNVIGAVNAVGEYSLYENSVLKKQVNRPLILDGTSYVGDKDEVDLGNISVTVNNKTYNASAEHNINLGEIISADNRTESPEITISNNLTLSAVDYTNRYKLLKFKVQSSWDWNTYKINIAKPTNFDYVYVQYEPTTNASYCLEINGELVTAGLNLIRFNSDGTIMFVQEMKKPRQGGILQFTDTDYMDYFNSTGQTDKTSITLNPNVIYTHGVIHLYKPQMFYKNVNNYTFQYNENISPYFLQFFNKTGVEITVKFGSYNSDGYTPVDFDIDEDITLVIYRGYIFKIN